MSDCDDPECPGCIMDKAIKDVMDQGLDVDDVLALFFLALTHNFSGLSVVGDEGSITLIDETVH